jgi:ATP diphosphatase
MKPSRDITRLIAIMAALRTPRTGCPWDLEQNFSTIAPYTIEEAYEVEDAITRGDMADLREELGDLLLQVVFHARMAEEQGAFDFGDVVRGITEKLLRRHPHVFGKAKELTPEAVKGLWDRIKHEERRGKASVRAGRRRGRGNGRARTLAGVPLALPALTRAFKLQEKAGKVGFDWNDARSVLKKIREEIEEISFEIERGDRSKVAGEIGDLLFAVVNLARHLDVDPEGAVRAANLKFERRFASIERALARCGKTPSASTLEEMDALWNRAKAAERKTGGLRRKSPRIPMRRSRAARRRSGTL